MLVDLGFAIGLGVLYFVQILNQNWEGSVSVYANLGCAVAWYALSSKISRSGGGLIDKSDILCLHVIPCQFNPQQGVPQTTP